MKSLSQCIKSCTAAAIAYGETDAVMTIPPGEMVEGRSTSMMTRPDYVEEIGQDIIDICGAGTWADKTPMKLGVVDTGADRAHVEQGDLGQVVERLTVIQNEGVWDESGHGSWCCGALVANNRMIGVVPKAICWSYKGLNSRGSGSVSGLAAATQHANENGIEFCNHSYGGSPSQLIEDQMRIGETQFGVHHYSSIGNSGFRGDGHPGNSDFTRGVGAIDNRDNAASFTSRSTRGWCTGRGVNVQSTMLNGSYGVLSGTSMSGPIEMGKGCLAAGYFDRLFGRKPTPQELKDFTLPYMRDLGARAFDTTFFNGHLNLRAMVEDNPLPVEEPPADPPVEPSECEGKFQEIRRLWSDRKACDLRKTEIEDKLDRALS